MLILMQTSFPCSLKVLKLFSIGTTLDKGGYNNVHDRHSLQIMLMFPKHRISQKDEEPNTYQSVLCHLTIILRC